MELPCGSSTTFGISSPFGLLSPSQRQVVYALLTRLPLDFQKQAFNRLVRLACVKHAASVRPEPGSNSPRNIPEKPIWLSIIFWYVASLLKFRKRIADCYVHMFVHTNRCFCDAFASANIWLYHVLHDNLHCLVFKEHP